jgi:hypothetical protein
MTKKDEASELGYFRELNKEYLALLTAKEHEVTALHAQINSLNVQNEHNESVRTLMRKLFDRIDSSIMRYLTTKGQKNAGAPSTSRTQLNYNSSDASDQLEDIARLYDAKEFFRYKTPRRGASMKIQYRIAAKAYRIVRSAMLLLARKLLGIARRLGS